ncbi:hypothetical protein AB0C77_35465 [Streptomyces sp. NPDC048629]|uniref:hypothetical protein n=1 Tax=Streptomyces sp. NPDC048629 TaxID=3154824 RepID=UPI00341A33EC
MGTETAGSGAGGPPCTPYAPRVPYATGAPYTTGAVAVSSEHAAVSEQAAVNEHVKKGPRTQVRALWSTGVTG